MGVDAQYIIFPIGFIIVNIHRAQAPFHNIGVLSKPPGKPCGNGNISGRACHEDIVPPLPVKGIAPPIAKDLIIQIIAPENVAEFTADEGYHPMVGRGGGGKILAHQGVGKINAHRGGDHPIPRGVLEAVHTFPVDGLLDIGFKDGRHPELGQIAVGGFHTKVAV